MDTAPAVAGAVEILCLCLPGDVELEALQFDGGLIKALLAGSTVIDHATGDRTTDNQVAARLAELDLSYRDAPLSGGCPGAKAHSDRRMGAQVIKLD